MKKVSLSTKIVGLVVTAVFTVGACLFASTYYFVDKGFQDQTQQEIGRQADAVQLHFDSITARMSAAAKLTASRKVLAEAIEKGDTAFVQKLGKEVMRDSKAGFITIADKNGNVVGRGHSDKAGDSVLSQPNVKKALAGEASTGIEEGTVVKFSLRAGAPVKIGDKVVGSVTTGVDLTPADHAVVEEVKKLFGIECTLFQGDTRVTTTLMKDGQRVIGTKMDNPKVLDTVLAKGQRFLAINKILGKDYTTAYWPLKDASGKVIGMLFIGKDRAIALAAVRNTEWSILAILAIVGALMVFAGILVARSITRPINRAITSLSEAAEQVVSASGQVSSASQSLAEGASEQAASIEETSSSLEEMSSMTKQNADNASTADNLMKESKQMVERANGSMTELTQSMEDISKASDETSKIIKTIDEIAFQTNLLALNAAVEAARAGEAGAGLCRGGRRGEKPRHAGRRGRQEHLGAHRGDGEEGQGRLGARRADERGLRGGLEERRQGGGPGGRDRRGLQRAGPGDRPDQQGRHRDGQGDPADGGQRRGVGLGLRGDERPGRADERGRRGNHAHRRKRGLKGRRQGAWGACAESRIRPDGPFHRAPEGSPCEIPRCIRQPQALEARRGDPLRGGQFQGLLRKGNGAPGRAPRDDCNIA